MFHGILRGTGIIIHLTGIHGVRFTGTLITDITTTTTTNITGITAVGTIIAATITTTFTTTTSGLILRELITELNQGIITIHTLVPILEKMVKHFTPERIQDIMQEHVIMFQLMVAEQTVLNQPKAGQLKVTAQVLKDLRLIMVPEEQLQVLR